MNDDLKDRPSRARYDKVKSTLDLKWRRRALATDRMTREIVDQLWDAFGGSPWTWCGFWQVQPDGLAFQPGPARPDPSQGAVPAEGPRGEVLKTGIAKRDGNLIYVPAFEKNLRVWAVFEARSAAPFDDMDARWIERLFKAFMLVEKSPLPPT